MYNYAYTDFKDTVIIVTLLKRKHTHQPEDKLSTQITSRLGLAQNLKSQKIRSNYYSSLKCVLFNRVHFMVKHGQC